MLSIIYVTCLPYVLFPDSYAEIGGKTPQKRILTMIAIDEIETIETPEANEPAPAKKPISEAKLQANRRNGALSHGPTSVEGSAVPASMGIGMV